MPNDTYEFPQVLLNVDKNAKKKKTERGSVPLSVFPLLREGAATRWLRAFVGSAKLKCLYPFTGKHSA